MATKYFSFRKRRLRILASTWQEYLLVFIIVLLSCFITGRSFSIAGLVRYAGKTIYKNYQGAIVDFKENSGYRCISRIIYYDHISRKKVFVELPVLSMFQNEIILYDDRHVSREDFRLVIPKDDIEEIEIISTEEKLNTSSYSGSDVNQIKRIPADSFISGTVILKNYDPAVRSSRFISVQKGIDSVSLSLSSALPAELSFLTILPSQVQSELQKCINELPENRENVIQDRINVLKKYIDLLNQQGFYAHYSEIMQYNKEMQSLQARLDTLRLNHDTGAVTELKNKIERLKGFGVSFDVVWLKIY